MLMKKFRDENRVKWDYLCMELNIQAKYKITMTKMSKQ